MYLCSVNHAIESSGLFVHAVPGTFKLLHGGAVLNSLVGAHAERCRFFASNNPKETSCKSPDQEIEAARANRHEIKGSSLCYFSTQ